MLIRQINKLRNVCLYARNREVAFGNLQGIQLPQVRIFPQNTFFPITLPLMTGHFILFSQMNEIPRPITLSEQEVPRENPSCCAIVVHSCGWCCSKISYLHCCSQAQSNYTRLILDGLLGNMESNVMVYYSDSCDCAGPL